MILNSCYEITQSESSQASSSDGHMDCQKCETSPPVARLAELKRLAKCDAERDHELVEVRKQKKSKEKPGKITKSKRQKSNIRSAEICRAADRLYVGRLEKEILLEEETYLQMMKEIFDQETETVRLKQRISQLEEQILVKEEKESWKRMETESSCSDVVSQEFFLAFESEDRLEELDEKDGHLELWEGDSRFLGVNVDEKMDFEEVNAPMTPPPPVEMKVSENARNDDQVPTKPVASKALLSPVSVFDLEQKLEYISFSLEP